MWQAGANGDPFIAPSPITNTTGYAYQIYDNDEVLDDWLITPGINLTPGITYVISYDIEAQCRSVFENIRTMAIDRSGILWFGGQDGAFRYDGKTVTTFTVKEGLLENFVGTMIIDSVGNIWFGHGIGRTNLAIE